LDSFLDFPIQPDKLAEQELRDAHRALDIKASKLRQNLVGTGYAFSSYANKFCFGHSFVFLKVEPPNCIFCRFDGPEDFKEAQFTVVGMIDSYGDPDEAICGIDAELADDEFITENYTRSPCWRSLSSLFQPYVKITYQLLLPLNGNWVAKPFQSSTGFAAQSQHDPPVLKKNFPKKIFG
jgi:hypothetical protein